MYMGGLENHPILVERISTRRPLWGNAKLPLSVVRSPISLTKVFRSHGIRFPTIHESSNDLPRQRRWLVKPRRGAGGRGIYFQNSIGARTRSNKQIYFQEFIEGLPCSAGYVGLREGARLLGTTRQLVGEFWLDAAPFRYCGSIGPLPLEPPIQHEVEKIGNVLARDCLLRGLFGVDFILSEGVPWPVEVNPRYPASTETLEYSLGIKAMAFHRLAFDADMPKPLLVRNASGSEARAPFVGKAILFAKRSLEFPKEGPWTGSVRRSSIEQMPDYADIPEPGRVIRSGAPILTFFGQASTLNGCLDELKRLAQDLDHWLF
jgi:predicted ATP-grasp superfamily ATP-dependent carboligase